MLPRTASVLAVRPKVCWMNNRCTSTSRNLTMTRWGVDGRALGHPGCCVLWVNRIVRRTVNDIKRETREIDGQRKAGETLKKKKKKKKTRGIVTVAAASGQHAVYIQGRIAEPRELFLETRTRLRTPSHYSRFPSFKLPSHVHLRYLSIDWNHTERNERISFPIAQREEKKQIESLWSLNRVMKICEPC